MTWQMRNAGQEKIIIIIFSIYSSISVQESRNLKIFIFFLRKGKDCILLRVPNRLYGHCKTRRQMYHVCHLPVRRKVRKVRD